MSARFDPAIHNEPATRPCRPLVWLWILSIAQYSYRYILQVNDPNTSHQYNSTPPLLSAIKYGLLFGFVLYAVVYLGGRTISVNRTYRALAYLTVSALITLSAVLILRLAFDPGSFEETVTCAVQLIPWMASVFLIPLVFKPDHSVSLTLITFERIAFWIAFPFWVITVVLAIYGLRYPALSYPGLLIRFGGILDDPNGYACLCLLLLVICCAFRKAAWKTRAGIYIVMLIATLSVSGYITAVIILICLAPSVFLGRFAVSSRLIKICVACVLAIIVAAILGIIVSSNELVNDAIASLYSAKTNSATVHISDLLPDEATWDASSPFVLLFGSGGFSENFYWRVLANFGWVGLIAVVAILCSWTYCALRRVRGWEYSVGTWTIGILLGSNGIAYILTFPLNLIYWSLVALLVWTKQTERLFARSGIQTYSPLHQRPVSAASSTTLRTF